jgi:D-alanyl-D-alanine carboxypeptidase (penicillin-binding protein 5/6)
MSRKVKQALGIFLGSLFLLFTLVSPHITFANPKSEYKSAVLMDSETGQILFEENPHEKVIPASIVKMMVLLLVIEKIDAGVIHLSDVVTVSAWASKIGGHQVYLAEGERFPLEELLKAIAISSANDAATAVAEFLAGNTEACVDLMNARAKELGMNDTIFANVHGLPPDKGQKENSTSAYDVALLGRELLKYPQILSWTATLEDTFRNGTFTLTNTNRQLIQQYRGVDGLKTGFHPRGADFSICVTAQRQDRRLIAVVMGAPRQVDRYRAVVAMLNLGFNQFERVIALRKGFSVGEPIPVSGGKSRTTTLVASDNAVVLVKKEQKELIREDINIPVQEIIAPASQGTRFGEVVILVGDRPVTSVDLVVEEDIKKGTVIDLLKWWIMNKVS